LNESCNLQLRASIHDFFLIIFTPILHQCCSR